MVDARHRVAGPDEEECPGVVELVERRLGCSGITRALEDDAERLFHGPTGGRCRKLFWTDDRRGADGQGVVAADLRWLAHGYVANTASDENGDSKSSDGTGARHEHAVLGRGTRQADCVYCYGRRLREGGLAGGKSLGHG